MLAQGLGCENEDGGHLAGEMGEYVSLNVLLYLLLTCGGGGVKPELSQALTICRVVNPITSSGETTSIVFVDDNI